MTRAADEYRERYPLTRVQTRALSFIEREIRLTGWAPTIREVGERLGYKSSNSASELVVALERKGVIERARGRGRAMRITEAGYQVLAELRRGAA